MQINRPVEFTGTEAEARANRDSHDFTGIDGRCMDCDSRPSYTAASYPCGVSVPREIVAEDGSVTPEEVAA